MMMSDKGVSSGYEHKGRVSRWAGKPRTKTYESPIDSANRSKGADSSNGESKFVRVYGDIFPIGC